MTVWSSVMCFISIALLASLVEKQIMSGMKGTVHWSIVLQTTMSELNKLATVYDCQVIGFLTMGIMCHYVLDWFMRLPCGIISI